MKVELEFITPDAEAFIGRMAGKCYNSSLEHDACIRRAKHCKDSGHLATLRFAHAVFNISGISRACSHQFVRSKHLDFLQRSQRYCKEDSPDFINPNGYDKINIHYERCLEMYKYLLEQGYKKEDARYVLPEGTCTELNVVGNLQAWKDFIALRSGKEAQWEIREVAIQINNILAKECPNIFEVM